MAQLTPAPLKQTQSPRNWMPYNSMYFPRALRDAIPEWEDSARCLMLASIDGACSHTAEFGRRVQIHFQVEETGKLDGAFHVYAELFPEAARALAKTLEELADRVEAMKPTPLGTVIR